MMIQSSPLTVEGGGYSRRRSRSPRPAPAALVALAAVLLAALLVGVCAGARNGGAERDVAERYAAAWSRGDLRAMYGLLSEEARRSVPLAAFVRAHRAAAVTATVGGVRVVGEPRGPDDDVVRVPLAVATRAFATLRLPAALPIVEEDGEPRVAWAPHLAFPGLRPGERLGRTTRLPPRATLLAADGTTLAAGPQRRSPDPVLAASIAGTLGPPPPERVPELRAAGVPPGAAVGITGLERFLDARLRGRPGGVLRAGDRVLTRTAPVPAPPVRATVAPETQRAAVAALGGRFGGVVALVPRTGEIRAAAGIALTGLQPPASTLKIITLAAALEEGLVRPGTRFPVETAATLEGVELENANGEACGGTLVASFAESCNSVFAPLGARLGAERLVAAAERFGFNRPPGIPGAATSTIPPAGTIGDDLAVGATAIGQGRVQATPLQVALLAATIANGGRRPEPRFVARGGAAASVPAVPPEVARMVARAMRAVVAEGTGRAAALGGVAVAGKTGTAELRSTVGEAAAQDTTDTSAWFTAFAPVEDPEIAVAVLLVEAGAGGETAAPAAKQVLEAALR